MPPKAVKEDIARAKGYLNRNEFLKSIDAAINALDNKRGAKFMGKDRFEIAYYLEEYCSQLSNHPQIKDFLASIMIRITPFVQYQEGQEKLVRDRLNIIKTRMQMQEDLKQETSQQERLQRKNQLLEKAEVYLAEQNLPMMRSYFRRVAEEFGDEAGVLTGIGETLFKAELFNEAVEPFELALELNPRDGRAFASLVQCRLNLRDWEDAEKLYLAALKTFGAHPRTLFNLAKLYKQMRKFDDAEDYARLAVSGQPDFTEARELLRELNSR
jgi:tetratricopeptide (TPR) repeat protein